MNSASENLYAKRKKMFGWMFFILFLFFSGYFFYCYFYSSQYVSTNNAYIDGEIAEVTALTEGVVEQIHVIDTSYVAKGDLLVVFDKYDAKVALEKAEASFLKAKANMEHAEINFNRRKQLFLSNLISEEELNDTEYAFKIAQAAFQESDALKKSAQINYDRTKIYAPINGVIAQRKVQLGQKLVSGNKLLSIVPIADIHVNANFKENELKHIKIGQSVDLISDKYGSSVKFNGIVQGFCGGTGSAFAIIPAQNATGNWVKVVQRLPVRITLNPEELKKHPLEIGLSMYVKIKIHKE